MVREVVEARTAHHASPSDRPEAEPTVAKPPSSPFARAARVAGIGGAFLLLATSNIQLCMFARITHHPCPGCGLTRATLALLHGHVLEALQFHPLSLLISPLVILFVAYKSWLYVVKGRWWETNQRRGQWGTRASTALVFLTIAVWIARFFGFLGGPVPV